MYDLGLARDSFEKHARKTIAPERIASRIFAFHASPGPSALLSRQYGIPAASRTLHSLSTCAEFSRTYEIKACFSSPTIVQPSGRTTGTVPIEQGLSPQ